MLEDPYYLIRGSHLPEVMKKTVQVTELLQFGKATNVQDAVRQVGMSRSAYYKYRDVVKPFYSAVQGQIVTIALTLRHVPGVLSEVLNTLFYNKANILTIDQSLPLQDVATVVVSIETRDMSNIDDVLDLLQEIDGVMQVKFVGQS
ncbi:ACT domain-containing protein [Alicyclobacillus sp. SO9]|uniref:ACT domain-containing protein n=1 Tax=Alicyclobacillus sp. SO9 TaxID=2665646 RepID=UPI0018E7CB23|nr:ACT domain-containing protein [Alicyclobacillus sp. SO9]QQE79175.1 ACT domain-containing protein [Alicyclobacillus sp. SO9]